MENLKGLEENVDLNSSRSSNFTKSEIELLKKLIKKHGKIILSKKNNATSLKEKDETWEAIAKEFNLVANTYRSIKQLKYKWEYMKKIARREACGQGIANKSSSIKNTATVIISKNEDNYHDIADEPTTLPCDKPDFCPHIIQVKSAVKENLEEQSILFKSYSEQKDYSNPEMSESLGNISFEYNNNSLALLKEEKYRLEMELLKRSFENDEVRKQELHDLQVLKVKLEIDVLKKQLS